MKAPPLTYHRAASIAQAIELGTRYDGTAKLMAGGQSLMPMMNLRMSFAEHLIDVSAIAALRDCHAVEDKFFIGAGVTHAMLEDGRIDDPARGYLRHVAGGIAYRSVRNRGTIGGSLAHADPAADWPAALLALDAIAVIDGPQGERQVPLAEFQRGLMETALGIGEILKGILVPRLSDRARWSYRKFTRKVGEFAHSIAAVVVDPALGISNVVVGAVGGKPVRLVKTSARLAQGQLANQDLVREDLSTVEPSSYEFQLHKTIVLRAISDLK
ncbi:MAG TPA: FAD binding domain-containing protein [Burkholderiales bacterium]|nr:FAD binding domain-containing protein [Burkholderiales bacterium]